MTSARLAVARNSSLVISVHPCSDSGMIAAEFLDHFDHLGE
jgi:hypothetical protein